MRNKKVRNRLDIVFIFILLILPLFVFAQTKEASKDVKQVVTKQQEKAKITGITINEGMDKLSISILSDKEIKRNSYRTINPYAIVIELFPAELAIKDKSDYKDKDVIKNIYFKTIKNNVVKVVIGLEKLLEYDILAKQNTTVVNIVRIKPLEQSPKPQEVVQQMEEKKTEAKLPEKSVEQPPVSVAPLSKPKSEVSTKKVEVKPEKPSVKSAEKLVQVVKDEEVEEDIKEEKTVSTLQQPVKKRKFKKGSLDQLITLELVNADLLSTLRAVCDDVGYNLIASKSIVGTVTLTLRDVSLRRAFDAMLNMNGFSYVIEGNIIEVGTSAELTAGDEQGKLITESFALNFAKADSIQIPLKAVLSKNGSIQVDTRTNTLLITDTMPKLRQVAAMIEKLDTTIKQVMIEAKLVEVNTTKQQEIGIKWQAAKGAGTAAATGATGKYPEMDMGVESKANPVSPGFTGVLQFGTIAGSYNVGLMLNALASSDDANILANPRVATLDNKTAKINITTEFPYISAYNSQTGVASYSSVSTGITLEVTPQINPGGYITMKVKPSVSSVVSLGPPPVVDKRETETEVLVKEGDTLVIGGLLKEEEVTKLSKVPLLGDIPLVGFLFKDKFTQKSKKDLIIFITPHIL